MHSEGPRRWLAPKPGSWLLEWASGKWHRDEGKPIDKSSKYASPPGRPTTSMATTTNSRGGGEPENDAGLANGNAPEWVTISLAGAKGQWDEEEYFHHNHHVKVVSLSPLSLSTARISKDNVPRMQYNGCPREEQEGQVDD